MKFERRPVIQFILWEIGINTLHSIFVPATRLEVPRILVVAAAAATRHLSPDVKKHRELVEKYGDTYLSVANDAIASKGIRRLIITRCFEVYAADSCDKLIQERG